MTPKEKANGLFNKYFIYLRANLLNDEEAIEDAKVCALIAIDELIIEQEKYNNGSFYPSKYWQEVKEEIKKL